MLKKKTRKSLSNYLIVGLACVAVGVFVFDWYLFDRTSSANKINSQISRHDNYEIQFNHFTITIPSDYVLSENPKKSQETYEGTSTSSFADESGCVRVENIQSYTLQRNISVDMGYSTWHPVLEIQSWNNNEIKYFDAETQKKLLARIEGLSNLSRISTLDLHRIAKDNFQSEMVALFNPWEGYLTCGGIYSLPTFIEKQVLPPQLNWNEVYYGEAYEGNGDTFGAPVKVVLARKGDSWLLVKEQQVYPDNFKSVCHTGDLSFSEFSCARDEWSNLRSSASYRSWVQQVLTWVK